MRDLDLTPQVAEFRRSGIQHLATLGADPATGRELWRMKGLESNAVTTPLVGDGVVVFSSEYVFDGDDGPYAESREPRPGDISRAASRSGRR